MALKTRLRIYDRHRENEQRVQRQFCGGEVAELRNWSNGSARQLSVARLASADWSRRVWGSACARRDKHWWRSAGQRFERKTPW